MMGNTKKQKVLLASFICIVCYFIYRAYDLGCKVDFILAWTKEIKVFSIVIWIGIICSIVSLLFIAVIKKHQKIKMLLLGFNIILVIASFMIIPDWDAISDQGDSHDNGNIVNYTWIDANENC